MWQRASIDIFPFKSTSLTLDSSTDLVLTAIQIAAIQYL